MYEAMQSGSFYRPKSPYAEWVTGALEGREGPLVPNKIEMAVLKEVSLLFQRCKLAGFFVHSRPHPPQISDKLLSKQKMGEHLTEDAEVDPKELAPELQPLLEEALLADQPDEGDGDVVECDAGPSAAAVKSEAVPGQEATESVKKPDSSSKRKASRAAQEARKPAGKRAKKG